MGDRKLGVVVVGVGVAGKVRIRDLKPSITGNCDWKLVGYVSRRKLQLDGVQQLSEDEAFNSPEVHAVIVCTEPASHENIIRKALNTGRHVLVEFPITTTAEAAKGLYTLAKEKGLTLHEESISLLTPGYASIKDRLDRATAPLVKGDMKLMGSYNGWVEDFEKSGGPFAVSVSMIHTFYTYFGEDIKAVGGKLEKTDTGLTATATLSSTKCSNLTLTVERSKQRGPKGKTCRFEFGDGQVIDESPDAPAQKPGDVPPAKKIGLFMQDFLTFVDEASKRGDNTKDVERTIRCMEIADALHKHMGL